MKFTCCFSFWCLNKFLFVLFWRWVLIFCCRAALVFCILWYLRYFLPARLRQVEEILCHSFFYAHYILFDNSLLSFLFILKHPRSLSKLNYIPQVLKIITNWSPFTFWFLIRVCVHLLQIYYHCKSSIIIIIIIIIIITHFTLFVSRRFFLKMSLINFSSKKYFKSNRLTSEKSVICLPCCDVSILGCYVLLSGKYKLISGYVVNNTTVYV